MIAASPEDGIFVNYKETDQYKKELDIDELMSIGCIKEVIHDEED